mgnify:CR=1 FL=1
MARSACLSLTCEIRFIRLTGIHIIPVHFQTGDTGIPGFPQNKKGFPGNAKQNAGTYARAARLHTAAFFFQSGTEEKGWGLY